MPIITSICRSKTWCRDQDFQLVDVDGGCRTVQKGLPRPQFLENFEELCCVMSLRSLFQQAKCPVSGVCSSQRSNIFRDFSRLFQSTSFLAPAPVKAETARRRFRRSTAECFRPGRWIAHSPSGRIRRRTTGHSCHLLRLLNQGRRRVCFDATPPMMDPELSDSLEDLLRSLCELSSGGSDEEASASMVDRRLPEEGSLSSPSSIQYLPPSSGWLESASSQSLRPLSTAFWPCPAATMASKSCLPTL